MRRQGKRGAGFNSFDRGHPCKFRAYGALTWLNALRVTTAGANVDAIVDQFGMGNHATQAVDANRAAYSAAGWVGKPCLDYGATGTKGYSTPAMSIGLHTFICVVRGDTNSGYPIIDGAAGTGGGLFGAAINSSDVRRPTLSGKQVNATWIRDGVRKQVGRTYGGTHATHRVYMNGIDQNAIDGTGALDPGSTPRSAQLWIGCNEVIANAIRGLWVECIAYATPLPPLIFKRIYNRQRALWLLA